MLDSAFKEFTDAQRKDYAGPALFFDLREVALRIRRFKALERGLNCEFLLAVKAFDDPRVLSLFARLGIGFDVSNRWELESLRRACPSFFAGSSSLSATGPLAPSLAALGAIRALERWSPAKAVMLNLDSLNQLQRLAPRGSRSELTLGMRVAVDPPQASWSRFGIRPTDAVAIRQIAEHPNFGGFHCHVGGERSIAPTFLEAAQAMLRVSDEHGLRPTYFNLGGGLQRLSPDEAEELVRAVRSLVPERIRLLFEPGAFWFEGTGFAVCEVQSVKPGRDEQDLYVTVDISRESHLRWATPQLLLMLPEHTAVRPRNLHLFGGSCAEEDLIGVFPVPLPRDGDHGIALGSRLLLSQVRSYCAAWNRSFNGIPAARVLFYDPDGELPAEESDPSAR